MVKINLLIGAPSGAGGSAPMNPGAINFGGISVPGAGPSNFYLAAGSQTPAELMADIESPFA